MASANMQIDNGVVKDDLNCIKCKSVPKDACLVPCGCRLCRVCINDLMASGVQFCPGPLEECGESPLSQFVTDYRANRNISKLPIKCSNNGCVHACQLANMEEHLRLCPRKSVECPFRELGCTQDKLAAEEMNGHLQRESFSHSELLIGMINNVNNEMGGSKRDIEMMKKIDENYQKQKENLDKADEIDKGNILLLKSMYVCHKSKIDMLDKADESIKIEINMLKKADEDHKAKFEVLITRDESNEKKIEVLEKTNATNKKVIELLKCDLRLKNDQIKSIMDDIKSMKGENKESTNRMTTVLTETKREIDQSRDSSNSKVLEYVDKGLAAIKKDIQSINQGTQSIKADIDSIKSQIKVPMVDSPAETVPSEHVSTHEKHKCQYGSGRDGARNVRVINDNSWITLMNSLSNLPRSGRNSSEDRQFNYDISDQEQRDIYDNGGTRLQRYPRSRGRSSRRRNYRRRGSRFGMEAASPYLSADEDQDF